MSRLAKSRLPRLSVPATLAAVLAGGLALGASGIASASATTPNVMILTSRATQGAVEFATSGDQVPVEIVTDQVPRQSLPSPTLILVVGYGPNAVPSIEEQARAVAPSAPILVVSLPRDAGFAEVSNAVHQVIGGFGLLGK